jgi:DNA-binding CsgD family transcriptional regulator
MTSSEQIAPMQPSARPAEAVRIVHDHADRLFTWRYERERPQLVTLYNKAAASRWNSVTDLDWATDVDPERVMDEEVATLRLARVAATLPGSPMARFGEKEFAQLGVELLKAQLSQFMHGEQGAMMTAAKLVETVPWIDAKYYAATQTMDEARHTEVFARYLHEKVGEPYPMSPYLQGQIFSLLEDSRWDIAYLGMQVIIESLALGAFGELLRRTSEPLLRKLLTDAGHLETAATFAGAAYDQLPPDAPPDAALWLSFQIGRCTLFSGRPVTARRWLGEALARCDASGNVGPSRLVLSALATAHCYLGDARAATEAIQDLDQRPEFGFARPEQDIGRAWAAVARGDLPGARATLQDTAARARKSGYKVCEATALHDIARLGDSRSVRGRLVELAEQCEGALVDGYARRAGAAASRRPDLLAAAADNFEQMGAILLAAESAMEAAQGCRDQGDPRAATTLERRAATLAASCEGARTPLLAVQVSVSPLSPRERDIASLAARGESSRAIAEQLFLSVRTVNNHLGSIYTKLGIRGRSELTARLASADVDPEAKSG